MASTRLDRIIIRAYVTIEAKQLGERILEHQIRVAFSMTASLTGDEAIDAVLPLVIKATSHTIGGSLRGVSKDCQHIDQTKEDKKSNNSS